MHSLKHPIIISMLIALFCASWARSLSAAQSFPLYDLLNLELHGDTKLTRSDVLSGVFMNDRLVYAQAESSDLLAEKMRIELLMGLRTMGYADAQLKVAYTMGSGPKIELSEGKRYFNGDLHFAEDMHIDTEFLKKQLVNLRSEQGFTITGDEKLDGQFPSKGPLWNSGSANVSEHFRQSLINKVKSVYYFYGYHNTAVDVDFQLRPDVMKADALISLVKLGEKHALTAIMVDGIAAEDEAGFVDWLKSSCTITNNTILSGALQQRALVAVHNSGRFLHVQISPEENPSTLHLRVVAHPLFKAVTAPIEDEEKMCLSVRKRFFNRFRSGQDYLSMHLRSKQKGITARIILGEKGLYIKWGAYSQKDPANVLPTQTFVLTAHQLQMTNWSGINKVIWPTLGQIAARFSLDTMKEPDDMEKINEFIFNCSYSSLLTKNGVHWNFSLTPSFLQGLMSLGKLRPTDDPRVWNVYQSGELRLTENLNNIESLVISKTEDLECVIDVLPEDANELSVFTVSEESVAQYSLQDQRDAVAGFFRSFVLTLFSLNEASLNGQARTLSQIVAAYVQLGLLDDASGSLADSLKFTMINEDSPMASDMTQSTVRLMSGAVLQKARGFYDEDMWPLLMCTGIHGYFCGRQDWHRGSVNAAIKTKFGPLAALTLAELLSLTGSQNQQHLDFVKRLAQFSISNLTKEHFTSDALLLINDKAFTAFCAQVGGIPKVIQELPEEHRVFISAWLERCQALDVHDRAAFDTLRLDAINYIWTNWAEQWMRERLQVLGN